MSLTQKTKAEQLRALHHSGKMLIFPNVWDVLGARLLDSLNYKAVATASAAIAYANGYNDGEQIPLEELLSILRKIATSVAVPVTADIESGYADNNEGLRKNTVLFLETGIAGINIEDTNKQTGELYSIDEQCNRLRIIRQTANEYEIPLFINARTDVYVNMASSNSGTQREQALERGSAYKQAGADCIFPIALKNEEEIESLVRGLEMPVNILAIPGIPDFQTLDRIGVARVSLGPGFLKIAIRAMKDLATQLQQGSGLEEIISNEVTSDYLKKLINKDY